MTDKNEQQVAGLASDLNRELEAIKSCDEILRPNYCPKCGCDDITVDSGGWSSVIECDDCDYRKEQKCDEDTLIEKWNRLKRKPKEVLQAKFEEAA